MGICCYELYDVRIISSDANRIVNCTCIRFLIQVKSSPPNVNVLKTMGMHIESERRT